MNEKYFDIAGRTLIAVLFFMGGVNKLMDPVGTAGYMTSMGVPMADILVWVAAIYLIVAAVLLVWGKYLMWVAGSLVLYTILVTLIFHMSPEEMVHVLKNTAVTGGLLLVLGRNWSWPKKV